MLWTNCEEGKKQIFVVMAKRRGKLTYKKGSSKRKATGNAIPKPKIVEKVKKVTDAVKSIKTTVNDEAPTFMVSVPIDVLYALNNTSMQHFNVNDIKTDVDEELTSNVVVDTLIDAGEQEAIPNSKTAVMIAPLISPTEMCIQDTLPTDETEQLMVIENRDISTLESATNKQPTMLDVPSIPTDSPLNARQEFYAIPKEECVENVSETDPPTPGEVTSQNNNELSEDSASSTPINDPTLCPRELSVSRSQATIPIVKPSSPSAMSSGVEMKEPSELEQALWPSERAFYFRSIHASRRSSHNGHHRPNSSPTNTVKKEECRSPTSVTDFDTREEERLVDREGHSARHFRRKTRLDSSPTSTLIKEEFEIPTSMTDGLEFSGHSTNRADSSPTNTIIKEERGHFLEHSPEKRSRSNDEKISELYDVSPISNASEKTWCTSSEPSSLNATPIYRTVGSFDSAASSSRLESVISTSRKRPHDCSHSHNYSKKLEKRPFQRNEFEAKGFSWPSIIAPVKCADSNRKMLFSVSPSRVLERVEDSESDHDYGWEDPPKLKPEVQSKSTMDDLHPSYQEKMKIFNSKLHSEYDLDVIEASRKELVEAIDKSITIESNKKLTELNEKIQKKKDDYIRELYGTDNFDHWDDDPALSNVLVTAKMKPFKSAIRSDAPLLDKMCMVDVVNATKLTPPAACDGNKFLGRIKQIENEYAGKEWPPHLLESIKEEKRRISDLVIKFIMPYYNAGRLQPKDLFSVFARKVSHIFYGRIADLDSIKSYVDDVFLNNGVVKVTDYIG